MRTDLRPVLWIVLGLLALAINALAVDAREVKLGRHTFTLDDGFEIELVAETPLVDRPITADFDDEGRLYVSDSSGSNAKPDQQLIQRPHRVVRLEDTDGDGRFDRTSVFADKLMFPEGTMWLDGSLFVATPPSIWKLTDTDGDGVADQRVEWFAGKTLTGCANDLHGPYAGRDGWIYWCKGAFAEQKYERPGRAPLVTKAAHIFRARPDGGGLEPVMTGGMDNPVDVVFTDAGERIFTTTFLQHPAGGRRDGLIHAIYGGVYGKVHDVIENHPRTRPEVMPVLAHLGPAAPSGLVHYDSDAFGAEFHGNLFAACFNLQKITRHVLRPDGGSLKSEDHDFLVSDNKDFHPTDVLEDADGSLLVVDTGGWYKLCCPTSQLSKPDVLGAIYRVRKTGAPHVEDPRGRKIAWNKQTPAELVALLSDKRPAVRRRAIAALAMSEGRADKTAALEAAIAQNATPEARRNAVWAATRIDSAKARTAIRVALVDPDETVRQAALNSISLWRDRDAELALVKMLGIASLSNRRAAAEALGRCGDASAVPNLLAAVADTRDTVLDHSLTYALIELADAKATATGLTAANPATQRAALVALDQMPGGKLTLAQARPFLASPDSTLRDTATWIVGRHGEWGDQLAEYFGERLAAKVESDERTELARLVTRFGRSAPIQQLLGARLNDTNTSPEQTRVILTALAGCGLKELPTACLPGARRVLALDDESLAAQAVAMLRAVPPPKPARAEISGDLLRLFERTPNAELRLQTLAALPGGLAEVTAPRLAFLLSQLDAQQSVAARTTAAGVLATAQLSAAQLLTLTDSLISAGPLEVDRLLAAFDGASDDAVGLKLVASLESSSALSSLRADAVKLHLAKFGPNVQLAAEKLAARINVDAARQRSRLEELLPTLGGGDVRRGQLVFNSAKAACSVCHAIGYLGGNIGPDLTRIGSVRTERDLLESILFPSASFVRSYEPLSITTTDGKVFNGLVRRENADEIVLATGANEETRVARSDIDEIRPGTVSVMPAGLDQQLTKEQLADLLAFLKGCK